MKKTAYKILIFFLSCLLLAGCGTDTENADYAEQNESVLAEQSEWNQEVKEEKEEEPETGIDSDEAAASAAPTAPTASDVSAVSGEADVVEIPAYSGQAYVEVNGNIPYFEDSELTAESYESYSELDSLGRCGVCMASIGRDIMPTEERGEIGSVRPSGWHTVKYPGIIDGNYLYNRCHLIGYQLAGENANVNNLITGTRYMNVEGMLPFENLVADYVTETGNHVMYRVTPVFEDENLVADGVLMEAKSVEDGGTGILFNVFCYNVQPGITINYENGDSTADDSYAAREENQQTEMPEAELAVNPATDMESAVMPPESEIQSAAAQEEPVESGAEAGAYAVNNRNGKIHKTGACPATGNGENAMKSPVYFGSYEEAEAYSFSIAPEQDKRKCGNCW